MSINLFALFVNYFGLSLKFEIPDAFTPSSVNNMAYLFTDSGEDRMLGQDRDYIIGESMYSWRNEKEFWPFTDYYDEDYGTYHSETRFRGIFADFDHSEFLVYSLLIFGIIFIRKLW